MGGVFERESQQQQQQSQSGGNDADRSDSVVSSMPMSRFSLTTGDQGSDAGVEDEGLVVRNRIGLAQDLYELDEL